MAANLRQLVRNACRPEEAACVATLAQELEKLQIDQQPIKALARRLVAAMRSQSNQNFVAPLMHEFSLSSQEGVALMCLAEALLRIPDKSTADRLIRDKLSQGAWQSHLGGSASPVVKAATWGLLLTGKLVAMDNALMRLLSRGGESLIRSGIDFAMRLLAQQFVTGETIESALARSKANASRGYTHSFDMLGEAAVTEGDAERHFQAYASAIRAIGVASDGRNVADRNGISVKLSALHPRYERNQRDRVMTELRPRLKALMLLARSHGIGFNIDAEEADRLELSLDLFESLVSDADLAGWNGLGLAIQAYQKRCPYVIDFLSDMARRGQQRLMVRLVKGAYWDSEIKRTQVDGLTDYPVYTRKSHTDLAYLVCANRLLTASELIYPQFATHNAYTLAAVLQMASDRGIEEYEFQCLHGMGEVLYDNVVGRNKLGKRCRIYAPVGTHANLLPYLVRRLLENGANNSFVNRIADETVPIDDLIEDPLALVKRTDGARHPSIPLPINLYGMQRVNSAGTDLADEASIEQLRNAIDTLATESWKAQPIIAGGLQPMGVAQPIRNPANPANIVGAVIEADSEMVDHALTNAAAYAVVWHQTSPDERAALLRRAADLIELNRNVLLSLSIREAGKTWANALAEVREAVDFCRYYAQMLATGQLQNFGAAPGVAVCISPWNFPLAIFVGQITAALAAGSPVIAKPAEQTPLMGCFAVELLHEAGIPRESLQFLPGPGETIGAALTADSRVHGVLFTGSLEVARQINKSVSSRPNVRLIAETGGLNAMIVDSSALTEQVVKDVMTSGFDSAGQRCSALRVLCLENNIVQQVLETLKTAMVEMKLGDPALLSTDIGPVIDMDAKARLLAHVALMRNRGFKVFQTPLPEECINGSFVPPTLIEIDSLDDLDGEVFGPVVHVLRFGGEKLSALVDSINASGYGLTLGLHSRISETAQQIIERAHVGNIYINRNMIGAVVGGQPFGGEGLSGTGPKAGGPLYLHSLSGSEYIHPSSLGCRSLGASHKGSGLFQNIVKWAGVSGWRELARLCSIYADLTLANSWMDLPGPTGERNTLSFSPRGRFLCLAADEYKLVRQFVAVFAVEGKVVTLESPVSESILRRMPKDIVKHIELLTHPEYSRLSGVLFDGNPQQASALRQRLADESGALIPLLQPGINTALYPIYRMVSERVVSCNTAAAGGNATLLSLDNVASVSAGAAPMPSQII